MNFKVHFWQIKGYANIDYDYKIKLKNIIKRKFVSLHKFSKRINITDVSLGHFLNKKESLIKIDNLIKILKVLNIKLKIVEKKITHYGDYSGKNRKLKFPINVSPLHIRIGASALGDGNIHKISNMFRWTQKDITPMQQILFNLGFKTEGHSKNQQITIPAIISKVICFILHIKPRDLKKEIFIKKISKLPKSYKVQFILSIIEDEGNIHARSYSGIKIRMVNRRIIQSLYWLCHNLNYSPSKIAKFNVFGYKKTMIHGFNINRGGMLVLNKDIKDAVKNYGDYAHLWKKRVDFEKRIKDIQGDNSKKNIEGKLLRNKIKEIAKTKRVITPLKIAKMLNIKTERAQDIMRRMVEYGELTREQKGVYTKRLTTKWTKPT